MDFNPTPEQHTWRDRAAKLAAALPSDARPADVVKAAAAAGLLTPSGHLLSSVSAVETLAHASASAGITLALHLGVIHAAGSHPAAAALVDGSRVGALSLASDHYPSLGPPGLRRPSTVRGAVPSDVEGREARPALNGRASWVAPVTPDGLAVIGAVTDRGLLACAVDLSGPGVSVHPLETVALDGIVCGEVAMQDAEAAELGPTSPIMARVRVLLAAAGLGMGRRALNEALVVARAYNRTGAGGEQTVQGLLADSATELDAAAVLTWKAAAAAAPSLGDASMAKLAATEATQRAVVRATQLIGGDSFRAGHVIDQLARDVRALELFAGRTEALREAIAAEIL